jgi:hypothetical protein
MVDSIFTNGRLRAPYFIFVRAAGRYSDADLLNLFGLATYRPTQAPRRLGRYAVLAGDGEWTMLADDWFYTLWHMPATRQAVRQLAQGCDVFACSVGDCDCSFDFVYYRDSRLVREYVVTDPEFRGGNVVTNAGEPLPGETAAFREAGELQIVLAVASSLGIRTAYSPSDVRAYAPPAPGAD